MLALSSSRPLSAAANQDLIDVIDHIRHGVMANAAAVDEPLVGGAVMRYLAASMLASFPFASFNVSRRAVDDDNPRALGRAITFGDEHASDNIAVGDIARAARASPSALTRMFPQAPPHVADGSPTDNAVTPRS